MAKAFASKGSAKKSYGFPIFSRKLPLKKPPAKEKNRKSPFVTGKFRFCFSDLLFVFVVIVDDNNHAAHTFVQFFSCDLDDVGYNTVGLFVDVVRTFFIAVVLIHPTPEEGDN